jgi:hypothetical protein
MLLLHCFIHYVTIAAITSTYFIGLKVLVAALAAAAVVGDAHSTKRFGASLCMKRRGELLCYSAVHAVVTVLVAGSSSVCCGLGLMLTTVLPHLIETVHCATVQAATPPVQVC